MDANELVTNMVYPCASGALFIATLLWAIARKCRADAANGASAGGFSSILPSAMCLLTSVGLGISAIDPLALRGTLPRVVASVAADGLAAGSCFLLL